MERPQRTCAIMQDPTLVLQTEHLRFQGTVQSSRAVQGQIHYRSALLEEVLEVPLV